MYNKINMKFSKLDTMCLWEVFYRNKLTPFVIFDFNDPIIVGSSRIITLFISFYSYMARVYCTSFKQK